MAPQWNLALLRPRQKNAGNGMEREREREMQGVSSDKTDSAVGNRCSADGSRHISSCALCRRDSLHGTAMREAAGSFVARNQLDWRLGGSRRGQVLGQVSVLCIGVLR